MANYLENATGFGVFDTSGNQLSGGTFDNFTTPPALPALASDFAPTETSLGNVITSQGSGASFNSKWEGLTFAPANAAGAPVNAAPAASSNLGDAISGGSTADYFLRVIMVILGFIFVAVGLNKLAPTVVPDIREVIRR